MNTHRQGLARAWADAIHTRRSALEAHAGLTQAKLARDLGVTPVTVWRWEHAKGVPSQAMQAKLVRVLGIDPATLHELVRKAEVPSEPAA